MSSCYHNPQMKRINVCSRIWLSVYNALTVESFDLESLFLYADVHFQNL